MTTSYDLFMLVYFWICDYKLLAGFKKAKIYSKKN